MSARADVNLGTSFFGVLTLVFITLKLLGKIDWSWWWVLLPVWGWFAVAAVITLACLLMAALTALSTYFEERR